MKHEIENDLGMFEGFNFRNQAAIPKLLTAQEVINWDHDKQGEAEFWPHNNNELAATVFKTLGGKEVTANEIILVDKLLELEEYELVQVLAAVDDQGLHYCREKLEDNALELLDDYCFYHHSQTKEAFKSIKEESAWAYMEEHLPETYKILTEAHIPGLSFDPFEFFEDCCIRYFEVKIDDTEHIIYWWI